MFCSKCGKEINDEAVVCIHCGCAVSNFTINKSNIAENRDWIVTMLLSWFLGSFGAHRFYTGHIGTGIVQLFTLGGCGIWAFIDWINVCFNTFRDVDNKPLNNYKKELGIVLFIVGLVISVLSFVIIVLSTAVGEFE